MFDVGQIDFNICLFVPRRPLDDKTLLLKIAVSTFQLRLSFRIHTSFIKEHHKCCLEDGTSTELPSIKAVLYALKIQGSNYIEDCVVYLR